MAILAVNAGSSSVKLSLIAGDDTVLFERELDAPRATADADELSDALSQVGDRAEATVHRIVHGGEQFTFAALVDADVADQLARLTELAPLHQPKSLAALHAVTERLPGLPAIACFDTAFHQTLPPAAKTYALPQHWRELWGLRRYGFHGLSHAWIARRAPEVSQASAEGPAVAPASTAGAPARIVSCHLGSGASLCAIADGESVDTTMGFTPLEGLVMATRSGSVDPGLLMWLLENQDLDTQTLSEALEHESGLLGLAGTGDMRELLKRSDADDQRAGLALDVYIHRLVAAIASMAASLGGLDALVFTGGVGEHAPRIRSSAADRLGFLGVQIDAHANDAADPDSADSEITAAGAETGVRTFVIRAREDLEMVRQARPLLDSQ